MHYSMNGNADVSTPLLVLTDTRTASASEIVAAALRDNGRAVLLGTRTLGKNVAQAIMVLSSGSGLSFTIRSYVSPTGETMEHGIEPDYNTNGAKIPLEDIRWNGEQKIWSIGNKTLGDLYVASSSVSKIKK